MVKGELGFMKFGVRSEDYPLGVRDELTLAPGSKATLVTVLIGHADKSPVNSVESTNTKIVSVDLDPNVRLLAHEPGDTKVWVEMGPRRDAVEIDVRAIARVDVNSGIPSVIGDRLAALVGEKTRLWVSLYDEGGSTLLGPGLMPVEASPADGAHLSAGVDDTRSVDVLFDAPSVATIAGVGGHGVTIDALQKDDIVGLSVRKSDYPANDFHVGSTDPEQRSLMSGATIFLELNAKTSKGDDELVVSEGAVVTSRTPDICTEVPTELRDGLHTFLGTGPVIIEGLRSGSCQVDIEFGGRTTSYSGRVEVQPSPNRDAAEQRALADAFLMFAWWQRPRPGAHVRAGGIKTDDPM
jgi:hypothetical protein